MSSSLKQLHEVLEEEYVSMYGPVEIDENATPEKRLDDVITKIHARPEGRTALCISGGGIRSATFALGIIQGLARAGLLKKFDYLSTVSGGGYVGSWLSSWIRRDNNGVEGVEKALACADTGVEEVKEPGADEMVLPDRPRSGREYPASKLNPEPQPMRHLREYSNYLSPKLGLLSGDSWTLAAMYVRNLLLNLLVLVPLLAAALAIPRFLSWAMAGPQALDPVWTPWIFVAFVVWGFGYIGLARPVDFEGARSKERKKFDNPDGIYWLLCVLPLTGAGVMLALFWARVNAPSGRDAAALHSSNTWAAFWAAFLAMTAWPYLLYYLRTRGKAVAARRAGFLKTGKYRLHLLKKQAYEAFAAVVAFVTACGLAYLFAKKVFDAPLQLTPDPARLEPLQRFFVPTTPQAQLYVCFAVPLVLLIFFVQASIFVGLSSKKNEDADREWWARAGAWLLLAAVALALLNVISVFGPIALYYAPAILASVGGIAGIIAALVGYSDKTPANQKKKEEAGPGAKVGAAVSALAVPLFVVFLLAAISFASTWIIHKFADTPVISNVDRANAGMQSEFAGKATPSGTPIPGESKSTLTAPRSSIPELQSAAHLRTVKNTTTTELLVFLGLGLFATALSFAIGVNKFSMNALYRNRLIRAYLGASRWARRPDAFTGFDQDDNLPMWNLRQELLWGGSIRNVDKFVQELQAGAPNTLAGHIWKSFDDKQTMLASPERRDVGVLVGSINELLLDPAENFSKFVKEEPAWSRPRQGVVNYAQSIRNRSILDAEFPTLIRFMPKPADAERELPDGAVEDQRGPMHVVNIALNLTSGDDLAWQQRMALSLTVSPLHTGSPFLDERAGGYRDSREYGGPRGISLGTAVSVSGAAASPNMGYHSSPVMAFLMTFFNIRLGAWLGNPGTHGETVYKLGNPTTNLTPFAKEATGSSDAASKWVYLSDGGHFENLALYEMVLRRCRYIVLSDGGCDPSFTFEDLGNAIRKIRTDFGIPIEVFDMQMEPRNADGTFADGRFIAQAHIRYSAIDHDAKDGKLIYIKAGVYKDDDLPKDVYNYAKESLLFPHEPTSDQFFSESQFESYRALGRYAVNELLATRRSRTDTMRIPIARKKLTVRDVFDRAEEDARQRRLGKVRDVG